MAPVIDATLAGSVSNSYVTLAQADAYAANPPWDAEWPAFTDDQRTAALITACTWLQTLDWVGTKCSPSSDDPLLPQRLAWPRSDATCNGTTAACTVIPYEVTSAQIELAFQFAKNPKLMTGSTGSTVTGEVKRQKLGDLEQEFFQSGSGAVEVGGSLIDVVPWLPGWLGCWSLSSGGSSGLLLRVRS